MSVIIVRQIKMSDLPLFERLEASDEANEAAKAGKEAWRGGNRAT
ncbi:MAG TPA: hypothetical protein P5125_07810 [Kiritimatiellia bacterium]|nr:hypothetical protein [Kiritimatiellia bacterium]